MGLPRLSIISRPKMLVIAAKLRCDASLRGVQFEITRDNILALLTIEYMYDVGCACVQLSACGREFKRVLFN